MGDVFDLDGWRLRKRYCWSSGWDREIRSYSTLIGWELPWVSVRGAGRVIRRVGSVIYFRGW